MGGRYFLLKTRDTIRGPKWPSCRRYGAIAKMMTLTACGADLFQFSEVPHVVPTTRPSWRPARLARLPPCNRYPPGDGGLVIYGSLRCHVTGMGHVRICLPPFPLLHFLLALRSALSLFTSGTGSGLVTWSNGGFQRGDWVGPAVQAFTTGCQWPSADAFQHFPSHSLPPHSSASFRHCFTILSATRILSQHQLLCESRLAVGG